MRAVIPHRAASKAAERRHSLACRPLVNEARIARHSEERLAAAVPGERGPEAEGVRHHRQSHTWIGVRRVFRGLHNWFLFFYCMH